MNKIAAIYARVSTAKQKEGENVQSQIFALQKYAKDNNYLNPNGYIFSDEGISGSTLQRPSLDRLREIVQDKDVDVVLVYSPDRLSRKFAFQILLEEEFRRSGVELIYLNTPKASTSEEQLSIHFRSIFAEYERAQIIERSRRGRNYKAKQGCVSVLTKAPYGYEYIKKTSDAPASYEIHPLHAEVVRKVFSYFVNDGLSLKKICTRLNEEGILPPKKLKTWHPSTIRHILLNSAYTGTAYFGKTQMQEGVSDRIVRKNGIKKICRQKARKDRPIEDWIPLQVPAIIEIQLLEAAKSVLAENSKNSSRNTRELSLLQGLIVCGECGHPFYKKVRARGTKKTGYYCCSYRMKGGDCKIDSIHLQEFDDKIWDEIINLLKNPELIEKEIARRASESQELIKSQRKRQDVEKELLRLTKARNKLLDAYQDGECLDLNELKHRMKTLTQQKNRLESELNALEAENIGYQKVLDMRENIDLFVSSINGSKSKLSIKEKQKVLRLLIDEIVVTKDKIRINHCIPLRSPLISNGQDV